MAVFVIDSSIEGFQHFCEKLASMVDLSHVSSFKDCLGEVSKGDIIVNVLDGNEDFDKAVGQFRKFNMELKVIGFYQDLSEEQIIEHSESKAAADIYLTESIDEDELAQSLKELGVTPQFFSEETKTLALGIVKDHLLDKSLTQNAKEISQGLDQVFSSALPGEFKKIKKENKKNQESESIEELSIGSEVSMSDEIDLDISDDEIELSGNEEELVQEVNPNEVALDDEESGIDLEFANNEDVSNTEFTPDEIDFGGDEEAIISQDDNQEEKEEEKIIEAQGDDGADIDLIEELSFGTEEDSKKAVEANDELEDNADSMTEDDGIKLFDDDSPSQVLNLGEATGVSNLDLKQTETESVLDEVEFGAEDGNNSDGSQAVDNNLEPSSEDNSLPDFDLSEVDTSDEDFDLIETETNTIQGVQMTSSDELIGSSDDSDDPLDDIKTKMMEIDKLLLSDEDEDEELVSEDISMVTDDQTLNQNITLLKESIAQEENIVELEGVVVEAAETPAAISRDIKEFQRSHEDELIRLGETISSLRNDRESLMDRVQTLEDTHDSEKKDFLSLKAELDEKKIEIAIIKKRYSKQIEDLNLKLDLVENKKDVLVEQNKKIQSQFEKLRVDKKTDISKVRYREQELEQKLELLRNDAEVQIQNRDHKILELKRRIDTLEFDIENSQIKERKSVDDQGQLEDKMHKVIKTLRSAIGDLEGDSPINIRERLIKKNLDV